MSLEFSRNVTFGQYIDISSPVHRLDPRIKMLSVACIMICTFMTRGFISLIPIVTLAVLIQITTRIPVGYTLRGYRLLFRTMLLFIPFQILFYRAPAGVIVEPYWQWWILSISSNGIIAGLYTLSRVVLLYHTINMLMFTTTMIDLSDGAEIMFDVLKKLRIPVNELVMTMTVALNSSRCSSPSSSGSSAPRPPAVCASTKAASSNAPRKSSPSSFRSLSTHSTAPKSSSWR